jgi:hypothetical protein
MGKSNLPEKVILGIFAVAFIILTAIFIRQSNSGSGHKQINIVVPYGAIAVFISLYLFREYNRVRNAKRENRREYMNERRQELLNNIIKKNKESTPNND